MLDKGKSRSLAQIGEILGETGILEREVQKLLAINEKVDVLEIGIGYGRALLELSWQFRDRNVRFRGVTLKPKAPLEKREDLRTIAKEFEAVPDDALQTFVLPDVDFYNATTIRLPDESIDLLYSAVTIRFMDRKAEFLEEVCRVLKPHGRAILDISESNWNYPYSLITDDRILTPYTNRLVLKYGSELIPLPTYLNLFEGQHFRFRFSSEGKCILDVTKLQSGNLCLELGYNDQLSMSGFDLPLRSSAGVIRSGMRSVYDVLPKNYEALFASGLLTKQALVTNTVLPQWPA